jgi:tetratricopeptide (TPR) repeat protein
LRLLVCLLILLPDYGASAEPASGAGDATSQTATAESGENIADWQARLELARLLSYLKRYNESIAEYQKVIKEKPDLLEARKELGQVLFWSGQWEQALKTLEQVPLEKMDDQTRAVLADLYRVQKRYGQAEGLYRAYLEKHPDDWQVRLKLADLLSWNKQYQNSLAQYEIILKARPDDRQVRRKYALVLSWAGKKSQAIKELQKTLGQ